MMAYSVSAVAARPMEGVIVSKVSYSEAAIAEEAAMCRTRFIISMLADFPYKFGDIIPFALASRVF